MNQHTDIDVHKLERTLIDSYRSRSSASDEVDVTEQVMRDVRRLDIERGGWTPPAMLDQLIWRTATRAAAVVLIVAMLTVGLFRAQSDGPALMADDFESAPLFGDW
jgi:anti-sigma factor RsiW